LVRIVSHCAASCRKRWGGNSLDRHAREVAVEKDNGEVEGLLGETILVSDLQNQITSEAISRGAALGSSAGRSYGFKPVDPISCGVKPVKPIS
jgi:hypothetical protein